MNVTISTTYKKELEIKSKSNLLNNKGLEKPLAKTYKNNKSNRRYLHTLFTTNIETM